MDITIPFQQQPPCKDEPLLALPGSFSFSSLPLWEVCHNAQLFDLSNKFFDITWLLFIFCFDHRGVVALHKLAGVADFAHVHHSSSFCSILNVRSSTLV